MKILALTHNHYTVTSFPTNDDGWSSNKYCSTSNHMASHFPLRFCYLHCQPLSCCCEGKWFSHWLARSRRGWWVWREDIVGHLRCSSKAISHSENHTQYWRRMQMGLEVCSVRTFLRMRLPTAMARLPPRPVLSATRNTKRRLWSRRVCTRSKAHPGNDSKNGSTVPKVGEGDSNEIQIQLRKGPK